MTTETATEDWKKILAKRGPHRGANALRIKKDSDSALLDAPTSGTSIDESRRCATFVISTPTPDRSEDVVVPTGVILDNYKRNPVVFYDHGFSGIQTPIGKCEDEQGNLAITVTDEGIEGTCYFSDTLEGNQIFQLVTEGVVRAASINLQPKTYTIRSDDTSTGRPGMAIDEWELLEWSVVGIPDNPQAILKILDGGKLAGQPICESIKKSLSRLAQTPKLLGRNMTDPIHKDGDDDDGGGMAMGADGTVSGDNATADEGDGADGGDATEKPPGAKALEECYAHVKSAANVLDRHASQVEHPKVQKCLRKMCDDMHGHAAELAECHKSNYAEHGVDALETEEKDPPITSKSAVTRLLGQIHSAKELHAIELNAMNREIKSTQDRTRKNALIERRNAFTKRATRHIQSLEMIYDDARQTVARSTDVTMTADVAVVAELAKELAGVMKEFNESFPRRAQFGRTA